MKIQKLAPKYVYGQFIFDERLKVLGERTVFSTVVLEKLDIHGGKESVPLIRCAQIASKRLGNLRDT